MKKLDFEIEVVNWHQHQKNDAKLKRMLWFRVEGDIFFDVKFSALNVNSKLLWFYLLAECCRKRAAIVKISSSIIAKNSGIRVNFVRNGVRELEQLQLIRLVSGEKKHVKMEEDGNTNVEWNGREGNAQAATAAPHTQEIKAAEKVVEKKSHWLVDMWNEFGAKLPKAHTPISSARLKKIQTRIKDRPDPELWKAAIIRLAESNFANGLNDRAWVAGFDFILQADSLDKILEGKYDNRRAITKQEAHYRQQMQAIENGEL